MIIWLVTVRFEIQKDQELLTLHENRLNGECYRDINYNVLTQDFIYAVAEYFGNIDIQETVTVGGIPTDEIEQQELISSFEKLEKTKIIEDLSNLKESEPETVNVNQKVYKRDNKTIAQLKILRDFKCQICGTKIAKKDGGFYIEAAHIKPKYKKGCETPNNILILCPNHHKEFDFGDLVIGQHSKEQIEFILNGVEHKIDLKLE